MAASVRELMVQTQRAVRSGDVEAMADLYHPNAALHVPGDDLIVGRPDITRHFTQVLAGQPKDVEHEVTEEHIHEVTPHLAIVDTVGTSRATGVNCKEGFTMVAVRDGTDDWLWAGVRGALVP
jgi:uncharacterized protein (TIGR02246 family)